MIYLRISIVCIVLLALVGCEKGITFNPNFHVINKAKTALVDANNRQVPLKSDLARQFGCMHRDKIVELKMLLRNSKQLKSDDVENETDRQLGNLLDRLF